MRMETGKEGRKGKEKGKGEEGDEKKGRRA